MTISRSRRTPSHPLITDDQHRWDFFSKQQITGPRVPNLDRVRWQLLASSVCSVGPRRYRIGEK